MSTIGGTMKKAVAGALTLVAALAVTTVAADAQVSGGNPTLQPWSTTTPLPEGRSRNGAVYSNGYVYVIGGVNAAGATVNTSYVAPVNGDGTIGAWSATTPLPGNRRTVRPVAYNGYVYFAGGNDGGAFQDDVYYAQIGAGGALGPWVETTSLPVVSTSHSTLAYNDYLYTVGGNLGPSCVENVRMAAINANGTIGAWAETSPLPQARCGNVEAVTIANGYMYAAGGYNNQDVTRALYYAQINGNGTLGPWQTVANALVLGREYNSLETLNGYLYAIAGQPLLSGDATAEVEVAAINANGSVGAFGPSTDLPGPRGEAASEVVNGVLYVFGGGTGQSGASPQSTVFFTRQAPPDGANPTVAITAPANGATVSGTVNVTANASDDVGVVGVQFLLGGAPLGAEDTAAPYSASWDTSGLAPGAYTLTARARDAAGNQATSTPVGVTVADLGSPTVAITAPVPGAVVNGTVNVTANASDNVGVVGVQFLLDGAALGAEDTAAPYSVSWTTTTATNGAHTLTARARDAGGNQTTSAAVPVTVTNGGSGLVGAFGFEEVGGTTVTDSSPQANNGTISGATRAAGRYGGGMRFDGTNDYVNVPDSNALDLTNGMTVSAWINPAGSLSGWRSIVVKDRSGGVVYQLAASNSSNNRPATRQYISGGNRTLIAPNTLALNTWVHLASTYNGSTQRVFLNGVQVASRSQTGSMSASTNPLRIGGSATSGWYFNGLIDEVRVYNRALSAAQILADSNVPVAPPAADTTAPILSNGLPVGTLPAGTTQTSLQVTTNESATCRYGTVAGTAYASLPNAFTTSGGTAHSTVLGGLVNGGNYAVFVRCQDLSGNATTADFGITFSVTSDTVAPTVSVTAPAGGTTVSGAVNVTANASDNTGVAGVQFLLDGAPLGAEDTTAPYAVSWTSTTASNGAHALTARARDAAGNQTTSTAVNVTVNNVAPPNLLAAYGLNETTGTVAGDSSPSGNPGTVTGGAWTPTGRFGGALVLDGVSNRVQSPSVNLTGAFTYEAWVLNPGVTTWETIITVGANRDFYLTNGLPTFWTGAADVTFGGGPLATGVWQHLAITYDGTALRVYVDGALYGSPQNVSLGAASGAIQVGAYPYGGGNVDFLGATVDEVRVYSRALSAAEIATDRLTAI